MALPDLLCIGAQKAGTTWLHGMLSQHPDVFRAPLKEIHYFDSIHCNDRKTWTKRGVKKAIRKEIKAYRKASGTRDKKTISWLKSLVDHEYIFTAEWYESIFSGPGSEGKIKFEITPAYSTLPLAGIKHVRSLLGNIPIIYIIRDPLARVLSQLRMKASRKYGDEPISEAQWKALHDDMWERGDYETFITRWLSIYPESYMHFIPFKRIATEPESVMREIEALAGLQPHDYEGLGRKHLSSTRFDVPQSVVDSLTEQVASQYRFLEQQFGKEFMSLI